MSEERIDEDNLQEEQSDLYEHHRIVVDRGQSLLRIDKFLVTRIVNISRSKIQAAANANCVLVNSVPVKSSYKVKGEDVISMLLPYPVREFETMAEDIELEVIYEDDSVVVVNKRAGMVVHPSFGHYNGTLQNALLFHFQKQENNKEAFPYLVHRIDKDTSGLLLVAKNEYAQASISKQFYDRTVKRKYFALVWGDVQKDEGTITGHIGRNLSNRKLMSVFPEGDYGKHAVSHYKVIERFRYVTLVECQLETGRTHQIRAHFKYIGHTLFNDEFYGGNQILKGVNYSKYKQFVENCFRILPRQALHAYYLCFTHPVTKEKLSFEIPLPEDMQEAISKWRNYLN